MTPRETGTAEVFEDFPWEPEDAWERDPADPHRDRAPLLPAASYFREFPWRPEDEAAADAGDPATAG